MRPIHKNYIFSFISFFFIVGSFTYIYTNFLKGTNEHINFYTNDISPSFEMTIIENIDDINNFLSNYDFIENYLVTLDDKKLNIELSVKKPFAKNVLNQEIIFYDGVIASFKFFNQDFIDTINLIDNSSESLQINHYLAKSFKHLERIFDINQIIFIDNRRYDLLLINNLRIMLPKKLDQKFLLFLENNFELIKQNSNFKEYLDLRNFHEKTIRAK